VDATGDISSSKHSANLISGRFVTSSSRKTRHFLSAESAKIEAPHRSQGVGRREGEHIRFMEDKIGKSHTLQFIVKLCLKMT